MGQIESAGQKCFRNSANFFKRTLEYDFETIIDVGAGAGVSSVEFAKVGKKVTAVDLRPSEDLDKNSKQFGFEVALLDVTKDIIPGGPYDAAWCNQVLEHIQDYGSFLWSIHKNLRDENGYLFLTVPGWYPKIVPGHTNMGWNVGQIMYNFAYCGFITIQACYVPNNIWVIAKKYPYNDTDRGQPKWLKYYPKPIHKEAREGIWNGDIKKIDWDFEGQLEYRK